jgi:hypothetical protein
MKKLSAAFALLALGLSSCVSNPVIAPAQANGNKPAGKRLDQPPPYGYNNQANQQVVRPVVTQRTPSEPSVETLRPSTPSEPSVTPPILDNTPSDVTTNPPILPEPPKPEAIEAPSLPYAKPIPGQPGRVYSPFNGKPVDVSGMSPGTKASCPYSGKHFRVP